MSKKNELKQWIWTEQDFDQMGWHDCHIHALAFPSETFDFVLDIDYIFQWVNPAPPDHFFGFWIAPATLLFENAHDVKFDFDLCNGMEIDSIERLKPIPVNYEYVHRDEEWLWTISCYRGDIELRSTGFKQYIRSAPELTNINRLDLSARGGYSFARGLTE